MTTPPRRERLRTATVAEIKDGARHLLVTGGPQAISLRPSPGTWGWPRPPSTGTPGLEALVVELAADLYDELRRHVERARDTAGDDPLDQLVAMARAFREWAICHPAEFTLAFGSPVPGMEAFQDGCLDADARRPVRRGVPAPPGRALAPVPVPHSPGRGAAAVPSGGPLRL